MADGDGEGALLARGDHVAGRGAVNEVGVDDVAEAADVGLDTARVAERAVAAGSALLGLLGVHQLEELEAYVSTERLYMERRLKTYSF